MSESVCVNLSYIVRHYHLWTLQIVRTMLIWWHKGCCQSWPCNMPQNAHCLQKRLQATINVKKLSAQTAE